MKLDCPMCHFHPVGTSIADPTTVAGAAASEGHPDVGIIGHVLAAHDAKVAAAISKPPLPTARGWTSWSG